MYMLELLKYPRKLLEILPPLQQGQPQPSCETPDHISSSLGGNIPIDMAMENPGPGIIRNVPYHKPPGARNSLRISNGGINDIELNVPVPSPKPRSCGRVIVVDIPSYPANHWRWRGRGLRWYYQERNRLYWLSIFWKHVQTELGRSGPRTVARLFARLLYLFD